MIPVSVGTVDGLVKIEQCGFDGDLVILSVLGPTARSVESALSTFEFKHAGRIARISGGSDEEHGKFHSRVYADRRDWRRR